MRAGLAVAAVFGGSLVLAAIGWIWRRRRRRRGIRMAEIWESWLRCEALADAERDARQALLEQVSPADREAVRQSLLDFERRLSGERLPMQAVRRELMDSVDRRLLNEEILALPPAVRTQLRAHSHEMLQTDAEARAYIAANELRLQLLREYGARRFGDRAEGDWFAVYEKASRLKQRGARNFIHRTLSGTQSSADDARYQTMTLVDHEIRARLLRVPAGMRFPGFSEAGKEHG